MLAASVLSLSLSLSLVLYAYNHDGRHESLMPTCVGGVVVGRAAGLYPVLKPGFGNGQRDGVIRLGVFFGTRMDLQFSMLEQRDGMGSPKDRRDAQFSFLG